MFSLICVWINGWVNNREAGDLRRHRGHFDVNVMYCQRRRAQFVPSRLQPCRTNSPTVKRPFHIGWFCSCVSVLNNIFYRQRLIYCISMYCSWKRQLLLCGSSFRKGSWIAPRVGFFSNRFTVSTFLAVQANAPRLLMSKETPKHSIFQHDFAQLTTCVHSRN